MATAEARQDAKPVNPMISFKEQLDQREGEFKAALPAHMPVERFMRVVLTAVQNNPDLIYADRRSFWNACMRAAQDGLLPDGREGAIVIYNTKEKVGGREQWIKKAQWMPMVFGILKKIRNSGVVTAITARVVYAGDQYRYWVDDDGEHVLYEPADSPDKTVVRKVFAMARTKDGEVLVEPLTPDDIEKIRAASKARNNGPWVDWWDEMAKKSAIRRLSKRLPMSTDLDDLIRRDDDLYDFAAAREEAKLANAARPRTLAGRLDALAIGASAQMPFSLADHGEKVPVSDGDHDPETGEIKESAAGDEADAGTAAPAGKAGERKREARGGDEPTKSAAPSPAEPKAEAPRRPRGQAEPTKPAVLPFPGPDAAVDDLKAWATSVLATATADTLNDVWADRIDPHRPDIFPADWEELLALYDERSQELAQ